MMNFIEFLFGDIIERCMKYNDDTRRFYYRFYDGITEENMEQRRVIDKIHENKKYNPNMDIIPEFINREFGEERGRILFQVYSEYSEIIKDGCNDVLKQAEEYFIENHEYIGDEDLKRVVNRYLDRIDELINQISSLEGNQTNGIFGNKTDTRHKFDRISIYGKILDKKRFNELIKLKREYDTLVKQFNHFITENIYDKIEIRDEMFNNHIINRINNLSERLTDTEKTFMAALLTANRENEKFFNNYNDYKTSLVNYAENNIIGGKVEEIREKIVKIKFENKYFVLMNIELRETEEKISKFIPVKPNVFIKFLPERSSNNRYDSCYIRQDCCLEFELDYDYVGDDEGKKVIKTILKVFLDTYNVASGGKFRPITERYKCDNIERHMIVYHSLEGNYSVDEFIKSSEKVQNVIQILNSFNFLKSRNLIESSRNWSKRRCLNEYKIYSHDIENIAKMNNPTGEDYTPNKIVEMKILKKAGLHGCRDKIIYFEDFNDDEGEKLFRVINLFDYTSNLRKPMEEECKKKLEDKAFLIEKVENSSRTDQDKLILTNKINSNKLNRADKLLLEDEIRSDIIKRTNETINKINLLPNSCLNQRLVRIYEDKKAISEEDKINLNAINKINESTADELEKMNHLDLANLDLTTKLTLIEIISSAKFDEEFKNNLIDKIKKISESELDEIKRENKLLKLELSKKLLIKLVETDNLKELQNYYKNYFGLEKYIGDECNILSYIKSCQDRLISSMESNILEDNKMWNEYFTSILDPNDQEHKSIFDFRELFEENIKKRKGINAVYKPAIPRILDQIQQRNNDLDNAILKTVMMHHTVRETMENLYIIGKKTYPYVARDGLLIEALPYQSKTVTLENLKGAIGEIGGAIKMV